MKIIYDEKIVLEDKRQEEKRVDKAERKYTRGVIFSLVGILALASLLGLALYNLDWFKTIEDAVYFGMFTVLGGSLAMIFIMSLLTNVYDIDYWDKPAYKYQRILDIYKNCTLLSQDINEDALELRFKDKESYITRVKVYLKEMQKREKDDVEEITINFNLNEIWIPYKEKEVIKDENN